MSQGIPKTADEELNQSTELTCFNLNLKITLLRHEGVVVVVLAHYVVLLLVLGDGVDGLVGVGGPLHLSEGGSVRPSVRPSCLLESV